MKLYELPQGSKLILEINQPDKAPDFMECTFVRSDGMYSVITIDNLKEPENTVHLAAWTPMTEIEGKWWIAQGELEEETSEEAPVADKGTTDMVGTRITPGCVVAYAVRSGNSGAMKVGVVADPDNYKVISIVDQYGHRRISQKGTLYDWSRTVVVPYEIIEDQEILNLIADARERIFA